MMDSCVEDHLGIKLRAPVLQAQSPGLPGFSSSVHAPWGVFLNNAADRQVCNTFIFTKEHLFLTSSGWLLGSYFHTYTKNSTKQNIPVLTVSVLANCGLYFEAIAALTVGFPQKWPPGLGVMICSLERPLHCLI